MTTTEVFDMMQEKLTTAVQAFTRNLATVRWQETNPSLLDNVFVRILRHTDTAKSAGNYRNA